jgi:hypothetical protein
MSESKTNLDPIRPPQVIVEQVRELYREQIMLQQRLRDVVGTAGVILQVPENWQYNMQSEAFMPPEGAGGQQTLPEG